MSIKRSTRSGLASGSSTIRATGILNSSGLLFADKTNSTNATFTNLTNPLSDGFNYISAQWLISGSFVVLSPGYADILSIGGGGGGGGGPSGHCGGGGAGGGIFRYSNFWFAAGSYTITVGAGGAAGYGNAGGTSSFTLPNAGLTTSLPAGIGGGSGGYSPYGASSGGNAGTCIIPQNYTPGTGHGPSGAGHGGGGGGAGGNAFGQTGGVGLSVSGWTASPVTYGAGKNNVYGPSAGTANTADGGQGACNGPGAAGGSGVTYIRYRSS